MLLVRALEVCRTSGKHQPEESAPGRDFQPVLALVDAINYVHARPYRTVFGT